MLVLLRFWFVKDIFPFDQLASLRLLASQRQLPVASQRQVPGASQRQFPVASQRQVPVASQRQLPVASQRQVPVASQRHCERSAATQNKSHGSGGVYTIEPSLEGFFGSSKEDPSGINAPPVGGYNLDPSRCSG